MDNSEEYDRRIADIYAPGKGDADHLHLEFEALTDATLGNNYDKAKLGHIESLQRELHGEMDRLAHRLSTGRMTREEYAAQFNLSTDFIFGECARVLGADDFRRLFGAPYEDKPWHISPGDLSRT